MKPRTIIAFAIVGAALAATGPVAAQSSAYVVVSQHTTPSDFNNGATSGMTVRGSGNGGFLAATNLQSQTDSATGVSPTSTQSISVGGDFDPRSPDGTGNPQLTVTGSVVWDNRSYTTIGDDWHLDDEQEAVFNNVPDKIGTLRLYYDDGNDQGYGTTDVYLNAGNTKDGQVGGNLVGQCEGAYSGYQWCEIDISNLDTTGDGNTVTLEIPSDNGAYIRGDDGPNVRFASSPPGDVTVSADDGTSATLGSFTDGETKAVGLDLTPGATELSWSANPGTGTLDWTLDMQTVHYDGEGSYTSAQHQVSNAEQAFANLTLANAQATVDWEYYDGSSWQVANSTTYTTSGNHTVDISGVNADAWRSSVSFSNQSGDSSARLDDEGILFAPRSPNITSASPEPGAEANDSQITLSADVEDPDFGTSQGDSVTAVFYMDGQKVDEQTITSNQTVSTTVEPSLGGTHNWSLDVEDSYEETDSIATREFNVPAVLSVYYETEPETLVDEDNLTLTMQFFPLDNGEITSREVTNGTVDLTGLPVDQRFVVTVKANESGNFVYRRIVLDSIYDSKRIFLLRETEPHSDVVFELQDPTGQFPPENTELFVEKPITINGTTEYYTIAGDTFGASGRFPAALANDERYRLIVNSDSNERILGAYTATGDELVPLQIQRIEPSADQKNAGSVYGSLTQNGSTSSLAVRFRNGQPGTEVTYEVTDDDGNVVVPETSTTATDFAHIYEFDSTGTQSYNVSYQIVYPDGTTQTGYFLAGEIGGIADRFDIDPQVLSIMSWVAILASMGLIVIVDRKLAPAVGTGTASLLTIMGTVAIPMPMLGVAGAVSVLTLFGGRQ